MFFKRKNKSVSIDFSNIYIKEFVSTKTFFKAVLYGNVNIKPKLRTDLMFIHTDTETLIYAYTTDFDINSFLKRIKKILK